MEPKKQLKAQNARRITHNAGFTLVEVIVSLVVILATAAGVFASFVAAQRYVANAKHRIVAVNFCRQRLEELRPYVRQDTWNNAANLLYAPLGVTQVYGPFYPWGGTEFGDRWLGSISYSVYSPPLGSNISYRTVRVTTQWREPQD